LKVISDSNDNKIFSAEDIRRYWRNEMSPAEMHALEKAAMDDPFLADALEGYSKLQKDPSDDIALLKSRIANRAAVSKVVPMRKKILRWQVAAAVILIGGLGFLTYQLTQENKTTFATVQKTTDSAHPAASNAAAPPATTNDSLVTGNTTSLVNQEAHQEKPQGDVAAIKNQSKRFSNKNDSIAIASVAGENDSRKSAPTAAFEKLEEKTPAKTEGASIRRETSAPVAATSDRNRELLNNISGRVVDQQNRAIPNALVKVNNANQVTSTDLNGNFQFKTQDSIADVSISSDGYQDKLVFLNSKQNGTNIALSPATDDMKEVVLSSSKKKHARSDEQANLRVFVMDAEPIVGWDKYNAYIDSNKRIPTNAPALQGEVVLSFKVNSKGELSSFDVEKSLNKAYDNEAIRLIKEGPGWRVTKGKKAKVKVIIPF
jgi:hypothetical protein